jgi:hypothetical protein
MQKSLTQLPERIPQICQCRRKHRLWRLGQKIHIQPKLLQPWDIVMLARVWFGKNFDPVLAKPANLKAVVKLLLIPKRAERNVMQHT